MRIHVIKHLLIVLALSVLFFGSLAGTADAQARLEVGIPGTDALPNAPVPGASEYIRYVYIFVLGFVGIAGLVSLVIWGTVWTASFAIDRKAQAIEGIKNTLIGLGLALSAFVILNTINPDLVSNRAPRPPGASLNPLVADGRTPVGGCVDDIQCGAGYRCVRAAGSATSTVGTGVCTPSWAVVGGCARSADCNRIMQAGGFLCINQTDFQTPNGECVTPSFANQECNRLTDQQMCVQHGTYCAWRSTSILGVPNCYSYQQNP